MAARGKPPHGGLARVRRGADDDPRQAVFPALPRRRRTGRQWHGLHGGPARPGRRGGCVADRADHGHGARLGARYAQAPPEPERQRRQCARHRLRGHPQRCRVGAARPAGARRACAVASLRGQDPRGPAAAAAVAPAGHGHAAARLARAQQRDRAAPARATGAGVAALAADDRDRSCGACARAAAEGRGLGQQFLGRGDHGGHRAARARRRCVTHPGARRGHRRGWRRPGGHRPARRRCRAGAGGDQRQARHGALPAGYRPLAVGGAWGLARPGACRWQGCQPVHGQPGRAAAGACRRGRARAAVAEPGRGRPGEATAGQAGAACRGGRR